MEDLKFTKEIKEKWLTALKSGEYIQGTIVLEENGQHCCLGVLAEIHPLLQISKEGDSCIYNGKYADYEPFNELNRKNF